MKSHYLPCGVVVYIIMNYSSLMSSIWSQTFELESQQTFFRMETG